MSQCQSSPTATQFATITTDSLSTTTSAVVTTIPAVVTTIESTICASATGSVSGACSTTEIVSTLTAEQTVTSGSQVVVTVPVTLTSATATLFGSSCSDGGSVSQPTSSSSSSISTLPPTTSLSVISSSSTLPGGSVTVIYSTSTAVVTPTTAVPVSSNSKTSKNLGAIIGGTIGGVGGLALLILTVWLIMRCRRKARDDDFDDFEGKWPMPVKRRRSGRENLALDDPAVPTPFDAYQQGGTNGGHAAEGMSAAVAGAPTTSNVRKRNPTSSEGFPNPWSAIASSSGYNHNVSPPGTTDNSVVSSGPSAGPAGSPRPLHVQNPNPGIPMGNTKDRAVFLSADQGMQVQGGQSSTSGTTSYPTSSSSHAGPSGGSSTSYGPGSSAIPLVHQDAGAVPVPEQPRRTKQAEAHEDVEHAVDAPPAYEA